MDWTPGTIATLTLLWGEGILATDIGCRLGCSKSCVIGKAHRLHLPGRPSPIRRGLGTQTKPKPPGAPKIAKQVKVKTPTKQSYNSPQPGPTIADQRRAYFQSIGTNGHTCTAMLGEPKTPEFKPCTEPALINRAFCLEHAVAYLVPVRPLLKRAGGPADPGRIEQG